jgi:Ca2+-transporting ATPase
VPQGEARALAFAAMVFGNLALIFINRSSDRRLVEMLREPNRVLWSITLGALAALGASIYVPTFALIFQFAPLGPRELAVAVAAGVAGVGWYEVRKLARDGRRV